MKNSSTLFIWTFIFSSQRK